MKSSVSQVTRGYLCLEGSQRSWLWSFKLHSGLVVECAERSCSRAHRLWSQITVKVWLLGEKSPSAYRIPFQSQYSTGWVISTLGSLLKNNWLYVQSSGSLRVVFKALKESKSSDFLFHQVTLPLITPGTFSPRYPGQWCFRGVLSRVTIYFCI